MVARISSAVELSNAIRYNENKVFADAANCIDAFGFPKDVEDLSLSNKLNFMEQQAALRPSMKKPGIHISLNFSPEEILPTDKLISLAADYMDGIGFGDQPYLVYQHEDAGHPHLHIVSLKVRADGSAIDTNYIGLLKSEDTRKRLEQKYGLVIAEERGNHQYELQPVNLKEVTYGKNSTKSAISKVLNDILKSYKYTTLEELNAVLSLYNVRAERGTEKSRVFREGGLLYHIIDKNQNKVGKPIKASRFHGKPTLKFLQEKFIENARDRTKAARHLRNMLQREKDKPETKSLSAFIDRLKQQGIDVVLRKGETGRIYGITYVDHNHRSIHNGSALSKDKSFAIAALLRHFNAPADEHKQVVHLPGPLAQIQQASDEPTWPNPPLHYRAPEQSALDDIRAGLIDLFAIAETEYENRRLPYHLRIGSKTKNWTKNIRKNT